MQPRVLSSVVKKYARDYKRRSWNAGAHVETRYDVASFLEVGLSLCTIALTSLSKSTFMPTQDSLGLFTLRRPESVVFLAWIVKVNYLIDEGMCVGKGSNSVINGSQLAKMEKYIPHMPRHEG